MRKNLTHYDFKLSCIQATLDEEKYHVSTSRGQLGVKPEEGDNLQSIPLGTLTEEGGNSGKVEKCFSFSRDYSFGEESYEDWSFIEKRPYDSLVRENLLDIFNTLEDPIRSKSSNKAFLGAVEPAIPSLGANFLSGLSPNNHLSQVKSHKGGYIPLDEQLMSDDIQQVYASRLHFQQKLK